MSRPVSGLATRAAPRAAQASPLRQALRRLTLRVDGWRPLALIALGALIRLGLLLLGWPTTDSDEGTMGLMALHINTRGERPLFFYGQSYMGTIQAYLGALLFHLFGASVFSLRLGLLLLFTLFLLVMYLLLRLLYGQTFALVGLLLLDLGGPDLLKPQLLALGGYPETLLFGALSLLLAIWLARSASASAARPGWRRLSVYGALGLTMGLGWWSDQLVFPLLVVAALLLVIFCRRELALRGLVALVAGLLVGLAPQFIYLMQPPAVNGPSAIAAFEWPGPSTLLRLPGTSGRICSARCSSPCPISPAWAGSAPPRHSPMARSRRPPAQARLPALDCARAGPLGCWRSAWSRRYPPGARCGRIRRCGRSRIGRSVSVSRG